MEQADLVSLYMRPESDSEVCDSVQHHLTIPTNNVAVEHCGRPLDCLETLTDIANPRILLVGSDHL